MRGNPTVQDISVVICTKNEELRIEDCLRSALSNEPGEIVVVDGNSSDRTADLALGFTQNVIVTSNSNLPRDRQIGIDAAQKTFVAMIDADHRLENDTLKNLLQDLILNDYDIVQSQLMSFTNSNFWNAAEEQAWEITHNQPGPRRMIGVAPSIFRKSVFFKVRFDDEITKTIDDTDFVYRLSKIEGIKYGIGKTKVKQLHFGSLFSYIGKFKWYGRGDSEFCRKHPERALSIIYHLMVRYPIIYSVKAVIHGMPKAIPFFVLHATFRIYGLLIGVFKR